MSTKEALPSWLSEARQHVPPWAESILWALHGAGFDPKPTWRTVPSARDSNVDIMEPLRKVVCP